MAEQILKLNSVVEEFERVDFHQNDYDLKESSDSVSDEAKFASFSQHSFLPSYHQSVCANNNNNAYEFGTISGEFVSVPVQRLVSNGLPLKKRTKGLSKLSMRGNNSRTKANKPAMANCSSSSSVGSDTVGQSDSINKRNQRGPATIPSHPCPECHKAFSSPGKLQQHSFVHSGERPFKCTECEKGFSSRFKLMRHALIHSNDRRYKCSFCDRCFHRKDHLKNHLQVHNPNKKTYKCGQCEKEYNSRLSFRKHVAIHAAESGDLECKVCCKRFGCTEEIMYHLKVHTGSRTIKSPNEKKFKCEFCERRFFTRKDVKRHLVVHTGRRDFLCQLCPQRFGRKDHLVRHIKKSHSALKMKENDAPSTQEHCIGAPIYPPHFDFLPSPSHLVPISQSDFPPNFSSQHLHHHHHHHHQRHGLKDQKHAFHTSPCMVSDTSAASSISAIYSSASTASAAYLISPFSPSEAPPHEYKLYDEIKTERDDDHMNACSSLDISQLLGYLPLPSSSSSQSGFIVSTSSSPILSHPPPPPSASPSSSVSAMVGPSVITSLDQLPLSVTPLPQFNQAFQ